MSHQSELISTDIDAYLAQHERKELLRLLTCGSVDDGKSTLIGRLLHDSKMIYEDQLAAIEKDSVKSGTTGGRIDLALLVDGLQAEREQGITIDVAYRYFSTAKRKFIIADTPGHEQYTRNMATGASTCDLAIILIDARHGMQTQTRRHSYIASLLGIKQLIVAINKMDLVDYSEARFEEIKADYQAFSASLPRTEFHFLPLSALEGDNVVTQSTQMPWFEGAPLMSLLEQIPINASRNLSDFRFPVQLVNRPNLNFRGYCGTIASGVVRKGDLVTALPSGRHSRIKSIVTYDEEIEQAFAPMAVTLTLEDEIDVSRGDMLAHSDNLPTLANQFEADLVWMADATMRPGTDYDIKMGAKTVNGRIKTLRSRVDINTLQQHPAPSLALNEIGRVELQVDHALCFDDYQSNRGAGNFIVIDKLTNVTVGAGMVSSSESGANSSELATDHDLPAKGSHSHSTYVTQDERAARFGQRPVTLLFIGVSGSGKSTLAHAVERELFEKGHASTVLDGKAMRQGISSDLDHSAAGRAENLRRSANIARFVNDSGLICCAAFVAPTEHSRSQARAIIGAADCYVIYLNPPLEVCQARDPSGLYSAYTAAQEQGRSAAADPATITDVPGVSFPYEPPTDVALELDTEALSQADCVRQIWQLLRAEAVI
jgi:bifunctional enzyme CysN/CysC